MRPEGRETRYAAFIPMAKGTPMRMAVALTALVLVAAPAGARPERYSLDTAASTVGFAIKMGQSPLLGQMPVTRADLTLDFDRVAASTISVTLDARGAAMNLPFATDAMKSDKVLDTGAFPEIRFDSTRLRASGEKATLDGTITIRGITRPITLNAQLFRQQGTAPGDRDRLSIHLSGSVLRSDFGATGFADMVGDEVSLDIVARIRRDDSN